MGEAMTTVSETAPGVEAAASTGPRTAVTAAGLIGALASAGYISGVIFMSDMTVAEAHGAPVTVVECLLAGLAYVVLAVSLTGLAGGTRLPRWALSIAAAGCAFIAIQAWAYGSVVADLAHRIPAADFEALGADPSFLFQLLYRPMGLVSLAGFGALAVLGWRRRAMSRGACVLLALAGLASLLGPFRPVGLLAGLALAWTARSARSAR
jgi:hypothetical protein